MWSLWTQRTFFSSVDCPAREQACRKCGKIGHFEKKCRTKVGFVKNGNQKKDTQMKSKQDQKQDRSEAKHLGKLYSSRSDKKAMGLLAIPT